VFHSVIYNVAVELNFVSSRGPLGCDAVQCFGRIPTFRRALLFSSSGDVLKLHRRENRVSRWNLVCLFFVVVH
jgi:hypothetical protein